VDKRRHPRRPYHLNVRRPIPVPLQLPQTF